MAIAFHINEQKRIGLSGTFSLSWPGTKLFVAKEVLPFSRLDILCFQHLRLDSIELSLGKLVKLVFHFPGKDFNVCKYKATYDSDYCLPHTGLL